MSELRSFLPGERFSPDAEGTVLVKGFIKGVVDGLVMDMDGILDKHTPLALPLLIVVVSVNLDSSHEHLLERVEDLGSKYIALVLLINILVETMHIAQDLKSSRPHRLIQTAVDLLDKVSPALEEAHETGQVLLYGDRISLETLLSLRLIPHPPNKSSYCPHYFRILSQIIHQFDTEIEE